MPQKPHISAFLFLTTLALGSTMALTSFMEDQPNTEGFFFPSKPVEVVSASLSSLYSAPDRLGQGRPITGDELFLDVQTFISATPNQVNRALDTDGWFIDLYGSVQQFLGRTYVDDMNPKYSIVRLSDGSLAFANQEPVDTSDHARSLVRLSQQLESVEIPLIYIQAPQKIAPNDTRLPLGVVDYGNDYADQILSVLDEEELPYIDLREAFAQQEEDWSHWFFSTDHHWTADGAFLANQTIWDTLVNDYEIDVDTHILDPHFYYETTYDDLFLGSQGKRIGSVYSGMDDFSILRPTFYTHLSYRIPAYGTEYEGSFDDAMLFMDYLVNDDPYNQNPYLVFGGGDFGMTQTTNFLNPTGPKIMLIQDSYAKPMVPFMALGCSELITMDVRYFSGSIMSYVSWLKPDIVLVMYTGGSTGVSTMFDFFGSSRSPSTSYLDQPPFVDLLRPNETLPTELSKPKF